MQTNNRLGDYKYYMGFNALLFFCKRTSRAICIYRTYCVNAWQAHMESMTHVPYWLGYCIAIAQARRARRIHVQMYLMYRTDWVNVLCLSLAV